MRTVLCESCGRQITEDLPIVPVRFAEGRKSPRHAWRPLSAATGLFCRDCATAERMQIPADALARPRTREFLDGTETLERCESCGVAVLLVKAKHRKFIYCSPSCRARIYREAAKAEPVEHPCQWCGTMIGGRADRKFCSSRCRTASHRESQRRAEKLIPDPGERADIMDMAAAPADVFEEVLQAVRSEGDASRENVARLVRERFGRRSG